MVNCFSFGSNETTFIFFLPVRQFNAHNYNILFAASVLGLTVLVTQQINNFILQYGLPRASCKSSGRSGGRVGQPFPPRWSARFRNSSSMTGLYPSHYKQNIRSHSPRLLCTHSTNSWYLFAFARCTCCGYEFNLKFEI